MLRRVRAVVVLLGFAVAAAALVALVFAALDGGRRARRGGVIVGSKAMTESIVLAEIMAQAIEQRLGLRVERRFNLGSTQICFEALRTGGIDIYPEYTGTALVAVLHRPVAVDADAVLRTVRADFRQRYGVETLSPLGFNNTYALAVPTALAQRLGVRTISQLRGHPELVAGFAPEFLARQDGWPGLRSRYGLRFRAEPRSMEAGLMYQAASSGQVDVVSAYSTDGRIVTMRLTVLEDDRGFFPPYQPVPLVRSALATAQPRLRPLLESLAGTITDDEMRRMNLEVDSHQHTVAEVARAFLARHPRVP